MKSLVLAAFVAATGLAHSVEAAPQEMTLSIEARTNAVMPGSSEGATKSVSIPSSCVYVSHRLEVLDRQPPGHSGSRVDDPTRYSAELQRDRNGRVEAVALTVVATVPPSLQASAIGVRLSVLIRCE
jgi:hypothetical protein